MNKKLIEYLIVATAVAILVCSSYSIMDYKYADSGTQISDSIFLNHPASSEYKIVGDTIEFKNPYDFYNMNVSKLNSTDQKLGNLLNHFSKVNEGKIDYKNESCYLITMEFDDGSGFKYHSMVIPFDSFNKENLTFTNQTNIYLFEGNNRDFVVDAAFNSRVMF